MVLDFSVHLHPGGELPNFDDIIGERHRDPDWVLDHLQRAGIDAAVLSQPFYMGHEDAGRTEQANDDLLEIVEAYDEYYGLAALPVGAGGTEAAAEFERCLDAGYHGGAIPTRVGDAELVHAEFEPVFEVADRTGAPLLVHPKSPKSFGSDTYDPYQLMMAVGREAGLCESIAKVIHEDVLESYPDLDLVFHHLGGNIASTLGRFFARLQPGRWPRQDRVKPFEEFKAQLEDRVYLDTCGYFGYHAPLAAALSEFPPSQIVFGTDAPFEARSSEELQGFVSVVEDLTSGTTANRILESNARDLLVNVE